MHKVKNAEIKTFTFSELNSDSEKMNGEFLPFSFNQITSAPFNVEGPSEQAIRIERKFERQNEFKIDEKVRISRGLQKQEMNDFENRIEQEVLERLEKIKQEAYLEGLEQGRKNGEENLRKEAELEFAEKMIRVEKTITDFLESSKDLLNSNKKELFDAVNRLTKWILLKEVSNSNYIERLLEKLILELNERRNLIIKVGKSNFSEMPEILKLVESRLGQLPNVRVEIVAELTYPGIILESENSLIDGSLESVFKNLDKVFDLVNQHESE